MNQDRGLPPLVPLALDNGYLRRSRAPAFWALSPHLLQQHTVSSCSLASAAMVLNAARGLAGQNRIGDLVSEARLLDLFRDTDWPAGIAPQGGGRKLAELARHLTDALRFFGLDGWVVEERPVAGADFAAAGLLRAELAAMESAPGRLLLANFHLDDFYCDGSTVGHFSPLGAFDTGTDRVLVLDVYKSDYEPSWAPVGHLLQAMARRCDDGQLRGYLVLRQVP
jgi:hypothetical protein